MDKQVGYIPWPLEPIYASFEERDKHRRVITKLLDANFGKVWRYYLKLKYVHRVLQHRIVISEIRDEEKVNLTAYKIKGISNIRRAYCGRALDVLKFYYFHGEEITLKEISIDAFRYKDRNNNPVIKDEIVKLGALPADEQEQDAPKAIDMKELKSHVESTGKPFELNVDDLVAHLEKKSQV